MNIDYSACQKSFSYSGRYTNGYGLSFTERQRQGKAPVPHKWTVGMKGYVVSTKYSLEFLRRQLSYDILGHYVVVRSVSFWEGVAKTEVMALDNGDLHTTMIHEGDLSETNTFVHPFPTGLPPIIADAVKKLNNTAYTNHDGKYALYTSKDSSKETYGYILNHTTPYEAGDPCDDCYDGECDYCDRTGDMEFQNTYLDGLHNTDATCWGDMSGCFTDFIKYYGRHPDTMAICLSVDDRTGFYRFGEELETSTIYNVHNIDIKRQMQATEKCIQYYTAMKQIGVIPKDTVLPTMDDYNTDWALKINDPADWSSEQLYFFMCNLRLPIQWPGVVLQICYYLDKGLHPLMAYTLAHCTTARFQGGHSGLDPFEMRLIGAHNCEIPYPDIERVLLTAIRVKKFLSPAYKCKSIRQEGRNHMRGWRMYWHIHGDTSQRQNMFAGDEVYPLRIRFSMKGKGIDTDNFIWFDPDTRKLQEV